MSKKRTRTFCIVIDASIGGASGPPGSEHPTATRCREFLECVRSVCHRTAWSHAIKSEWNKHQSSFAQGWLASMMSLKKLAHVTNEELGQLRNAIEEHSEDRSLVDKMLKDAHLIEATLATDSRCASLDENARGHFRRLASTLDSLRPILWVNPAIEDEQAVDWLEKGAPAKRSRRLKP